MVEESEKSMTLGRKLSHTMIGKSEVYNFGRERHCEPYASAIDHSAIESHFANYNSSELISNVPNYNPISDIFTTFMYILLT